MARSQAPKFGNWENEEDIPYTVFFENAGKIKQNGNMISNDSQEYPVSEVKVEKGQKVTKPNQTCDSSLEDNYVRRSAESPLHIDAISRKSAIGSPHGDVHRPRHQRQLSQDEGELRKPVNTPPRNENVNRRSHDSSPYHRHGGGTSDGETPKRFGSNEYNAKAGGKGGSMSSPSWERKGLSEDGHGGALSTPGRSRLRSVTRGDETPDHSPAVPKFGDWDESDPTSGDGYSQIFSRVRDEKHNVAGKAPVMPNETSYINGHKRISTATSKTCGCFPWSR